MARKKAAGSEPAPAPAPEPKAKAQPKAASPAAKPQAKAKAKAEPAPPKPVPKPEPVEDEEEEGEAKKKRRRAGANKKKEEPNSREAIRKEQMALFAKELRTLTNQLPFLDASTAPDKVLTRVPELKQKIADLVEQIDQRVQILKINRPKKAANTQAFDEVLAPSMAAAKEEQDRAEAAFEAYRQFVTDTQALKEQCQQRSKEFDRLEAGAREKERLLGSARRIAANMGVTVESIAKQVTSTLVDLNPEQMALYFAAPAFLNRRFEKAHGCLVDQIGGKGKGKGGGGPVQCKVSGVAANVEKCKADLLKWTELSRRAISIEQRRAGAVIGEAQAGLRQVEQDHNVLCVATKSDILLYGPSAAVAAAEKAILKALDDASAVLNVDIDLELGKVLVGPGGSNIRKLEADTKTQIKLNTLAGDKGQLVIRGAKDNVDKAKKEVDKFTKAQHLELVKLEADVMAKLFGGKGAAKGSGKGGKGQAQREVMQKWQEVRDMPGVTLGRKEGGVVLIGSDKKQVQQAKQQLQYVAARALYTTEDVPVQREALRALTDAKIEEMAKATDCTLTVRRGATPCVEIYGSDSAKDKAKAAIEKQLDAAGRSTELTVSQTAIGYLLKNAGEAMKKLEAKFDVGVNLSRSEATVSLVGAKGAIDQARAELESDISKYESVEASLETREITIDPEQVGMIVGKGGSTIKWIASTSGAAVNTSKDSTAVLLKGTAEQNKKAEKLIQETLEAGDKDWSDWKEPAATPAKANAPKKPVQPKEAPNLESGNLFPSLGASLAAGPQKKKARRGAPVAATPEKPKAPPAWPIPPVDESAYHEGKTKKVKKEGGKKGAEIAGAADMGGIEFFTTTCETPDGDPKLLELVLQEMNVPVDPTAEETKGGSGHVGKMLLSASDKQLALVAYVPQEKEESLSAITWMEQMIAAFGGYGDLVEGSTQYKAIAVAKQDGDKGKFPLKLRDEAIGASIAFLKSKGLFPDKDDDDEDDYCFGDDDFPCDQPDESGPAPVDYSGEGCPKPSEVAGGASASPGKSPKAKPTSPKANGKSPTASPKMNGAAAPAKKGPHEEFWKVMRAEQEEELAALKKLG